MRQYAGFGNAEESNRRYRYLFEQGQTGLSVAFDLPTQMGRDADHPLARGEVGRVGVSICSLARHGDAARRAPAGQDFHLDDDQRDRVDPARALPGGGGAARRRHGTSSTARSRTTSSRNTSRAGPTSIRRAARCGSSRTFSRSRPRKFRTGTRSRSPATTSAKPARPRRRSWRSRSPTVSPTSRRRSRPGSKIDAFASRLSFFFNVHNNFFEEIAKFRAARRLWARIMKDRFGAEDERSMMMRFHAQTAGSTLTAQQVDNNVVRVTLQALAAVLGGAQSLHTNSQGRGAGAADRAVGAARAAHAADNRERIRCCRHGRSARRLVLRREPHARTRKEDARVSSARSTTSAARWPRSNAATCSAKSRTPPSSISAKSKPSIGLSSGVNQFTTGEQPPGDILRVNPEIEQKQCERLARLRAERNAAAADAALGARRGGGARRR